MRDMKIEQLIKEIIKKTDRKIIIGIDGYSGAGKTTLLKSLVRNNKNILPIYMDDFILTGKDRLKSIKNAKDKSIVFELKWNNIKKIKHLVNQYRTLNKLYAVKVYNPKTDRYDKIKNFDLSKKILILEGIFLFHPKLFHNFFDIKIFLDANVATADKRRIKREKKRWGNKYFSEDHPDAFIRLFKIAYARYTKQYKPKKLADYVF